MHLALVAGWLVVVLAVSELVRISRATSRRARPRAAEEDERSATGEQRLALAQELHDVLAHNISLINVQAGVALHLLDEQPEQARPALATIKEASREALHELRAALDVLRRGEDAPLGRPRPVWPISTRWSTASGPAAWTSGSITSARPASCRPRSSSPPTGSCRRR